MRALYWDGATARVVDRPEPEASEHQAVVRVVRAGVCNTDLEIVRGYMQFTGILGHELVGVVERGPDRWLGKRVVVEINFACGQCPDCLRGMARHCPHRSVMGILGADGAMAEHVSVPVANLHEVPTGLDDDSAAFCEPLAAAFEILEQVHITPETRAVVLGDGKLGLLIAQVLFTTGADVLAVGKHRSKLDHLARRGIRTVLLDDWDAIPADVVVEATGSKRGLSAAIAATRARGTLVLKSTVAEDTTAHLAPLVINEIRIVGSRCGSFPPALRALTSGSVDVGALLTEKMPLERADDALRRAADPGVLKVMLTFD